MRRASRAPIVTAGLTCQPDIGPIRDTSESRVRPNASAVAPPPAAALAPSNLKPNISVATPTAKKTKIAVPRNSAANFRIIALLRVAHEQSQINKGNNRFMRPHSRRYCMHTARYRGKRSRDVGPWPGNEDRQQRLQLW